MANSFEDEIELLRSDLIKKYDELGMRASGDWAKNLEAIIQITASNVKAIFVGLDYTEYLTKGRTPGGFPPVSVIRKWIDDKGITPYDNISKDSLAYLIARKIANEGTEYFKEGGTDLVDGIITTERVRKIAEAYGKSILTNFTFEINEILIRA
jgi:hypothetical protein